MLQYCPRILAADNSHELKFRIHYCALRGGVSGSSRLTSTMFMSGWKVENIQVITIRSWPIPWYRPCRVVFALTPVQVLEIRVPTSVYHLFCHPQMKLRGFGYFLHTIVNG